MKPGTEKQVPDGQGSGMPWQTSIMPFGLATIENHEETLIDNREKKCVRVDSAKCYLFCNEKGTLTIVKDRDAEPYDIGVFNDDKYVGCIHVDGFDIELPPAFRFTNDGNHRLNTMGHLRQVQTERFDEDTRRYELILRLHGSQIVRRFDVKHLVGYWVATFLAQHNIVAVRLNGDHFARNLDQILCQVTGARLHSQRRGAFGLVSRSGDYRAPISTNVEDFEETEDDSNDSGQEEGTQVATGTVPRIVERVQVPEVDEQRMSITNLTRDQIKLYDMTVEALKKHALKEIQRNALELALATIPDTSAGPTKKPSKKPKTTTRKVASHSQTPEWRSEIYEEPPVPTQVRVQLIGNQRKVMSQDRMTIRVNPEQYDEIDRVSQAEEAEASLAQAAAASRPTKKKAKATRTLSPTSRAMQLVPWVPQEQTEPSVEDAATSVEVETTEPIQARGEVMDNEEEQLVQDMARLTAEAEQVQRRIEELAAKKRSQQ